MSKPISIRETILRALHAYRGDDLERARLHFARFTQEQMDKKYGDSGQTPRQIIADYEAQVLSVDVAQAWAQRNAPEAP